MPWLGEDKTSPFKRPNLLTILRWVLSGNSPAFPSSGEFEAVKPAFDNPPKGKARLFWIGHATCLLQVGGLNILTDAVFSNRCSPVQLAGPKRYVPTSRTRLHY